MNKKAVVALVLALVLCMTSVAAFAAGSKTTKDVVKTTTNTNQNTTPEATQVTVTAATAESKAELDAIAAFVNEGKPVAEFFGTEIEGEIAAEVGDVADVKMDEFFPIALSGAGNQAVSITLSTAASYSNDAKVVTLLGIVKDGKVVWTKVPCKVVNGKIVVDLSADLVAAVAGGSAMLSVLSNAQ